MTLRMKLFLSIGFAALLGGVVAGQTPPPAPAGPARGQGAGGQAPPGGRGPGGAPGRGGGFGRGPSFDAAAIERARPVYEAQCGFCHGNDTRGRAGGPDLARSLVVLGDTKGKELGPFLRAGRPPAMPGFPQLTDQQIADIAEFLHERFEAAKSRALNTMSSLVGDAKAGAAYFSGAGRCNSCHSVTGDLAGIGSKYDPPTLQDRLVNPRPGGGRGGQAAPTSPRSTRTAVVTLANGQTISGKLEYLSEFVVTIIDEAGKRRTLIRNGELPKVVVTDPLQTHFEMLRTFRDKDMQDVTAYLWTIK